MATSRIRELLEGNCVAFELRAHAPAFTAQQVAQYSHVPGKNMAKTIVVWVDDDLALAVVPATKDLNLDYLRSQAEAASVRLAEETEFVGRFRGCQLGAVPPFGNIFGMRTYVDYDLTMEDTIAFNAGTHTDLIQMKFSDYMRIALPCVVEISLGSDKKPGAKLLQHGRCRQTESMPCCGVADESPKQVDSTSPTGAD